MLQDNDTPTGSAIRVEYPAQPEETLVTDPRARLTPAQMVERKLVALLQSVPLPISRLEKAGPRRPMTNA